MTEEFFHPQHADPDRLPPLDEAAFARFLENIDALLETARLQKLAADLAAQKAKEGKP